LSLLAEKQAQAKAAAKPKPKTYSGRDVVSAFKKLLAWGHSGDGKTYLLLGPLLAGEKLLVGSADFGGQGLTTLAEALKVLKKEDLLDNIIGCDLGSYEDVSAFVTNPQEFITDLEKFSPTVSVLEGFSGFQIDLLDEYILSFESKEMDDNELREEGLLASRQDWAAMKRGTMRVLRKFLSQQIGEKKQHKIVTALAGKQDINALTKRSEQTALIQGSARDLIGAGFDLVVNCFSEEKDGKLQYFYRSVGEKSKYAVKSRGIAMPPVIPADPFRLWKLLVGENNV